MTKVLAMLLATFVVMTWSAPRASLAAKGDCGQPVSTGNAPTSTDCLYILRTAVGIQTCSPQPCICDTGAGAGITATDGLLCLRKAVGLNVQLVCNCAITTTSTSTSSTSSTVTLPFMVAESGDAYITLADDGTGSAKPAASAPVCPAR
jgi:hypothetical protein